MERIFCGEINKEHLNQNVLVKGWIKKRRKLGNLIFWDVSDRSGIVQVVVNQKSPFFEEAKNLGRECVIEVEGKVVLRQDPNPELKTGLYEIDLENLKVDAIALTPPMIIEDETDALEELRMKYRYLDLRRPNIQQIFMFRSKLLHLMRHYLVEHGFIEVETPILGKPTPEGARDYLVPSRIYPQSFYALPQSPQIYKQLLMVAGFERYFQVAKCFRDEDLRSDRQPEFTQLDIEMSFINELDIQNLVEGMLKDVFKELFKIDLKTPFLRLDYETCMNKYGSDKPDLRFGLELTDVSDVFKDTKFNVFKTGLANGGVLKAIFVHDMDFDKKEHQELLKIAKDNKALGLAWISKLHGEESGPLEDYLSKDEWKVLEEKFQFTNGTIFFSVGKPQEVNKILGAVRNKLGDLLDLKDPKDFKFLWVINWPLFEFDEEQNRYVAAHHPFTQPALKDQQDFYKNQATAQARAYDIVLNGIELGGGSIRITDPKMQKEMFDAIGLDDKEIENKFGFLIEAFKYGVPPHGGLAIGIDRFVQLLLGLDSIKECIAFPKNNQAVDPLMHAPNTAPQETLDLLKIKFKE